MKLIIACDPKGGIGFNGKLPWTNIQGDLPRFKALTTSKVVLMGRNTWDSLPKKPLPNRINVVVTKRDIMGVTTLTSLPDRDTMDLTDVWIIGSAKLIESSWHLIDEIHLSRTIAEYTCDTFIDLSKIETQFNCVKQEQLIDHWYEVWIRK